MSDLTMISQSGVFLSQNSHEFAMSSSSFVAQDDTALKRYDVSATPVSATTSRKVK